MTEQPTDALRLVPVEPTREMLDAAFDAFEIIHPMQYGTGTEARKAIWSAMLAAAPASPLPERGGELFAENANKSTDLDSLEKLADEILAAEESNDVQRMGEAETALINALTAEKVKALIAELKEARRFVEQSIDLMTDEYEDTKAHQEQARAFLSRNGKGEGG